MISNIKSKYNFYNITYVIFGIYIFTLLMDIAAISYIFNFIKLFLKLIRYFCYVIFLAKIFWDFKNGRKFTITMILLFILSVFTLLCAKNKSFIILLITLVALRNLSINKLIKIAFFVFSITFLCNISLALLNIVPDWTFTRGNIIRHSLGFIYVTDCISIYLAIILMYSYIKKSRVSFLEIIFLETMNIFLYKYTDGRMSFILNSALLTILCLYKIKFFKSTFKRILTSKIVKITCVLLPGSLFVCYNYLTFLYNSNNDFAKQINILLSNRLEYTRQAFNNYGVPLFGKEIDWNGWGGYGYIDMEERQNFKYNYVDSSYARIIFDNGIILAILTIIGYTYILIYNCNQRNYWMVIALYFILIWSFIEPQLINIGRNPMVVALIPLLEIGNINMLIKKKREKINEKISN